MLVLQKFVHPGLCLEVDLLHRAASAADHSRYPIYRPYEEDSDSRLQVA